MLLPLTVLEMVLTASEVGLTPSASLKRQEMKEQKEKEKEEKEQE